MHLNHRINLASTLCFVILGFNGCSKQEKQESYVAKVNDAVLTEDQVKSALQDDENKGKYRSEYINDWIENQILLNEAEKDGILKDQKYLTLIERSKQHLAAAMFIEKILEDNKIEISDEDVNNYYQANKNEFKLADNLYQINIISFSDFNTAVKFRQTLIETGWERAINSYREDKTILGSESSKFIYQYQVQPLALLRIMTNLQPGEVSIVIETEPMKFTIVQLIVILDKNSVPPFAVVKNEVTQRLMMIKRKDFIRSYIDKLITDHNLEIVRYSE